MNATNTSDQNFTYVDGYNDTFYFVNLAVIFAISMCVLATLLFLICSLCLRMEALRQYWIKDSRWGKEPYFQGVDEMDSPSGSSPFVEII
uniref:Uncharacterized protein n=1 Tax=Ciona intestinalis TaxID=7719 RepID=H2XVW3_CIOIN